jgi:hypothetical protein
LKFTILKMRRSYNPLDLLFSDYFFYDTHVAYVKIESGKILKIGIPNPAKYPYKTKNSIATQVRLVNMFEEPTPPTPLQINKTYDTSEQS